MSTTSTSRHTSGDTDGDDAVEVHDVTAQHRVGQHPHTTEVEQHRRVTEEGQPRQPLVPANCITRHHVGLGRPGTDCQYQCDARKWLQAFTGEPQRLSM